MKLTCDQLFQFRADDSTNPITGRNIKHGGRTFRQLTKACEEIEANWWYEMYDIWCQEEYELTSWHSEEEYDKIEKREIYEDRERN